MHRHRQMPQPFRLKRTQRINLISSQQTRFAQRRPFVMWNIQTTRLSAVVLYRQVCNVGLYTFSSRPVSLVSFSSMLGACSDINRPVVRETCKQVFFAVVVVVFQPGTTAPKDHNIHHWRNSPWEDVNSGKPEEQVRCRSHTKKERITSATEQRDDDDVTLTPAAAKGRR